MKISGKMVEYGIACMQENRLRRLLFLLNETDPVLVEMLTSGYILVAIIERYGIPLEELHERLNKLINLTMELRLSSEKLNDTVAMYECTNLAVVDIDDFLMAAEDLDVEITTIQLQEI